MRAGRQSPQAEPVVPCPVRPPHPKTARIPRGAGDFPPVLTQLRPAPRAIEVASHGDPRARLRALRERPTIALVGGTHATYYARDMARALALQLTREGVTILAGASEGVGASARHGAIRAAGRRSRRCRRPASRALTARTGCTRRSSSTAWRCGPTPTPQAPSPRTAQPHLLDPNTPPPEPPPPCGVPRPRRADRRAGRRADRGGGRRARRRPSHSGARVRTGPRGGSGAGPRDRRDRTRKQPTAARRREPNPRRPGRNRTTAAPGARTAQRSGWAQTQTRQPPRSSSLYENTLI